MAGVFAGTGKDWPEVLPGFNQITRFWDSVHDMCTVKIMPGEYYVSRSEEIISTVLGSCVSACIRDPDLRVGGMNHFMLPDCSEARQGAPGQIPLAARYGVFAMEHLINEVLKLGARRENLEVKLFGGGKVLEAMTDIGQRNITFVQDYLRAEDLKVFSQDLGGAHPRKVNFFPRSGRVLVKKLRGLHQKTIADRERSYGRTLDKKPEAGGVELF